MRLNIGEGLCSFRYVKYYAKLSQLATTVQRIKDGPVGIMIILNSICLHVEMCIVCGVPCKSADSFKAILQGVSAHL